MTSATPAAAATSGGLTADSVGDGGAMRHRQILEAMSGLLLALFIAMLSSTIVTTALPTIIAELHGSQTGYTWIVVATLLTSTATTPVWGKLADLFSKKLLVQVSIVIFAVGSVASGFAAGVGTLIAFRAVQGIGLGGISALAITIIGTMIPPRERGRYNGYLGAVMAGATVAGPLIGGTIVDSSLGWRWVFFVGAPFAVAALVILQKTLHVATIRRDVKVDYAGATLLMAGVSLLLVWVSFAGSSYGWMSWQTAAMVGGGVLLLGLTLWVERRTAEPIVPLDIVVQRTPALAIVASLAVGIAMIGGAVFLAQYFQIARGFSPTKAGLVTIPLMLGVFIASTISGRIITKTGKWKRWLVGGSTILVGGLAMLAAIDHETPVTFVSIAMLVVGLGVGALIQNLVLTVQNTVDVRDIGVASSTATFFRSLGGTIGVSVLGALLATQMKTKITDGLAAMDVPGGSGATGGDLDISALPAPVEHLYRAVQGDVTGHIFLVSAVIAAVGLVATLFIHEAPLQESVAMHPEEPAPGEAELSPAPA